MNKDLAINPNPKALFEIIDRNMFGFIYTRIHCCIVGSVKDVLWLRKEHTRIRRHCIVWIHVFFFNKILADISGSFKTGSAGYRYCLIVIESRSMLVILIPLKSVSAEAVASALYTHVFTKHGVCNTILLTDRGSTFRSALVKAIAKIFKVKQVFGMTARPTTLNQMKQVNKLVYNYLQAIAKERRISPRTCPQLKWGIITVP